MIHRNKFENTNDFRNNSVPIRFDSILGFVFYVIAQQMKILYIQ